ncbi:MAG: Fe-S protein [Alphaproteobacteria bacterium]|nr:MAG: Fe-S protein [Alphaproteobacteria bacterium]
MRLFSNRHRPVDLGPWPLERLPRSRQEDFPGGRLPGRAGAPGPWAVSHVTADYRQLFDGLRIGSVAKGRAPIPDDPVERARNAKASAYFLDATMVGIAAIPESLRERFAGHSHAVVLLVAWERSPRPGEPGHDWIAGAEHDLAAIRALEIADVLAHYFGALGFEATAHAATPELGDAVAELAWRGGLVTTGETGVLKNPFVGERFAVAVTTTTLAMAADQPLAVGARLRGLNRLAHAVGWGGVKPAWGRLTGASRPLHKGAFPMERIRRRAHPTTRIDADVIPRVPQRSNFFARARAGDLGEKAKREVARFAYKQPYAAGMMPAIQALVPLQNGAVADQPAPDTADPVRNAAAIKALAAFMGGDMVGIAPARAHAWYSHRIDGTPIEPYHDNAIVILIDQGFETMEGASGDDWISGAQSMRAYMRGAEIAGIIAAHIRRLGYGARAQTNADSDVLHIPLILEAGLGELSRIGELVLNPFVGPRFKSVVITTDMPLAVDLPIDFGLQDFCSKCTKCARECPCHAIPFGDKIMFNGYEMWKPDVEKCARYRITNPKGSACGRCMKTCPFNMEGLLVNRLFLWAAIHLPFSRRWIARLDDKVGHGRRNPVKKWWWDLEIIDGVATHPRAGTNARDLDLDGDIAPEDQKLAIYPFDMVPPPDAREPVPVDRKAGLARMSRAERPH